MRRLRDKIAVQNATVCIVGLGYVGLPLSRHFSDAGFEVVGFDIDAERVSKLQAGDSYIDDVDDIDLSSMLEGGFKPTTDTTQLSDCDAFILAVPTDVEAGVPDLSAVREATRTIAEHAPNRDILLVCSSTVYPGATDDVIRPTLETVGRVPGEDTLVAVVPERLNPGSGYRFEEIPLVVGADDEIERKTAQTLFDTVLAETVPVDSTITAESTKMVENTYRMVNIGFVNQFAKFAEEAGIDTWEVMDAASSKPFGFQPFTPGPGVGGHCIPVDPQYLTWRAKQMGETLPLVEQARKVNEEMPAHVFDRIKTALAAHNVALEDASVVVLGLAYKPNVSDLRNSPALSVCESLLNAGVSLHPIDPHVDKVEINDDEYNPATTIDSETLRNADAALILVNHDTFNMSTVADNATLVFDTQNAISDSADLPVIRLGDGSPDLQQTHSEMPVSRL